MNKDDFKELVSRMRTDELEFWQRRTKGLYRMMRTSEEAVDKVIADTMAKGVTVPDTADGNFFRTVMFLRNTAREYFEGKNSPTADRDQTGRLLHSVKQTERRIDRMIEEWRDEQARRSGQRVVWRILCRRSHQPGTHPVFTTDNRRLAEVELNDLLGKAMPGERFSLAKEILPAVVRKEAAGG